MKFILVMMVKYISLNLIIKEPPGYIHKNAKMSREKEGIMEEKTTSITFWIEDKALEKIDKLRGKYRNRSQMLRLLIDKGIKAHEKEG